MVCATGFRDTTRIASGSPEMWRDIALANRQNLAKGLEQFIGELRALQKLVRLGDDARLAQFFERAKQRRDEWCAKSDAGATE
jgi:prephenate dehydrogenase